MLTGGKRGIAAGRDGRRLNLGWSYLLNRCLRVILRAWRGFPGFRLWRRRGGDRSLAVGARPCGGR